MPIMTHEQRVAAAMKEDAERQVRLIRERHLQHSLVDAGYSGAGSHVPYNKAVTPRWSTNEPAVVSSAVTPAVEPKAPILERTAVMSNVTETVANQPGLAAGRPRSKGVAGEFVGYGDAVVVTETVTNAVPATPQEATAQAVSK